MRAKWITPDQQVLKNITLTVLFLMSLIISSIVTAKAMELPIKRSVATQPITSLEIIAVVKSFLSGKILSLEKQASYNNPDCHQVKLLEDKGEFQIIRLGCKKVVSKKTKKKIVSNVKNNKL